MKYYASTALVLLCVLALAVGVGFAMGRPDESRQADKTVVTTFYPVYVAALNLTDGVQGVRVVNMVSAQTGCLHDYQLSPDDLKTLHGADAVMLNGAGAESFLDEVQARYPDLPLIDGSTGIECLAGDEEDEPLNSHLWMSPSRYARQVQNWCDGLCGYDPENADIYRRNAAAYIDKINKAGEDLQAAAEALPIRSVVVFHESLSYLADELNLDVLACLPVGEEEGIASGDLTAAADAIRDKGEALLLYDKQYEDQVYPYLAKGVPSASLFLNTAVSGELNDKNAWLTAMADTAQKLQEVKTQ